MCKFRWGAALLTACLGIAPGSVSLAKPPDLPAEHDVQCPEECVEPGNEQFLLGRDLLTHQIRVELETKSSPGVEVTPLCLDVWSPSALPVLLQRFCSQALARNARVNVTPRRNASTADVRRVAANDEAFQTPEMAQSAEKARQLYEIANRCVREGNVAQARACLREAHLANPICRFGRLAMDRLQELESTDAEACEEPVKPVSTPQPDDGAPRSQDAPRREGATRPTDRPTDRSFQRVREATMPLGMVAIEIY